MDTLIAKDSEALKALFDPALADDLDTQALFEFIEGDIVSCEFTAGPSRISTHGGLYRQWDIGCDFATSAASYRMAIRITGGETDMAVQSLYIIRTEEIDPDTGYWGGIDFSSAITIVQNSP